MELHVDLGVRTEMFATKVRDFVRTLPQDFISMEYCRQLIRASGSVGANYIEANESLGKKDFLMRMRISRKEAKESRYWLRLIVVPESQQKEQVLLIQESTELLKIFSAIIAKVSNRSMK